MKNLISQLSGFIGEASMINRTEINKVFNRLLPEAKLERLLMAFGEGVASEAAFIWNDMLDAFTLSLSTLVDVQGSIATQAKKRVRAGVMGSHEDLDMFAADITEALVDGVLGVEDLEEASGDYKGGKERAQKRMDDAAKRGGIDKLIKATLQRIKATKEPAKLEGIVAAADALIKQLENVKKEAQRAAG